MIRDGKRNEEMTEMETSKDRKTLSCKPIGYIYSPYKGKADTPKNGNERPDTEAVIELIDEYKEGMADMRPGEKFMVLFWFDRSDNVEMTVPFHGEGPMTGLFSTHAPARPNPIGVSTISVTRIDGVKIYFTGADMFDGTPVLDIKSAGHD